MRATKAEVNKRVEELLAIRLAGAEFWDVKQYAAEKEWRVSERQLWSYIHKSDRLLAETLDKDRDRLINRHLAQRQTLFARAMQVSDYRTALAILKDEAELFGLYPGNERNLNDHKAVNLQVNVGCPDDYGSLDTLRRLMAAGALDQVLDSDGEAGDPPASGQRPADGAEGGPAIHLVAPRPMASADSLVGFSNA
jgi:hypothetical protein